MNEIKKVHFVRLLFACLGMTLVGSSYLALMGCRDCFCADKKPVRQIRLNVDLDAIWGKENVCPIVVIGSGAAGLTSAMYGARARIKTVVITGHKPGGALTETSYVENFPGSKRALGADLMAGLKEQAASFGAEFLDDSVERIDLSQWPFTVYTEDGRKLTALSIIVTTGSTPKSLGVPGEWNYWGRGVAVCAICDAPFYQDKDLIVVGGGDSAVEEATQLIQYARSVTILVRKSRMRAVESMRERLKAYKNIKIVYNTEIVEIFGNDMHVTGVKVRNNETEEINTIPIDGVFLALGRVPNSQLISHAVEVDPDGYVEMIGRTQMTSLPGVFAAGEVEDRRYRQVGVATGRGIAAGLDAIEFLAETGFTAKTGEKLAQEGTYFMIDQQRTVEIPTLTSMKELKTMFKEGSTPIFVDFFTEYCPSCKQMMPVVESAAQQFADQARFVKVDAEVARDIVEKYFVHKVPCLLVFKDGQLAARYTDAMNKQEFFTAVEQLIQ